MGMTNKQFQGFIRLALAQIDRALEETPDNKELQKLRTIFQLMLEEAINHNQSEKFLRKIIFCFVKKKLTYPQSSAMLIKQLTAEDSRCPKGISVSTPAEECKIHSIGCYLRVFVCMEVFICTAFRFAQK